MAKHDVKKLALLGLTSGLIISNPLNANHNQQILSQMNSSASENTLARLIASQTAGENWNPSDSTRPQNRQNSDAGPSASSGLRNDSGARGPGGVRQQTSNRDYSEQNRSQISQNPNGNPNRRDSSSFSLGEEDNHPSKSNNNNNSNNSSQNTKNSQLAIDDSNVQGESKTNSKVITNPNPVKMPASGNINQSNRNQGVKTPAEGKNNVPVNQIPGKNSSSTTPSNSPSEYAYGGKGASCGGQVAMNDSDNNQDSPYDRMQQDPRHQGYGHPQDRRAKHGCGENSCRQTEDQGRSRFKQPPQNQPQQHQMDQNQMGGQKAGFSDQQRQQRPGANGNQGFSAQRNNMRQQQPQDDYQGW